MKKGSGRNVFYFSAYAKHNNMKFRAFKVSYRTLRGQDQREKCTLNVVKYTFQVKCTLLTTKSALTVQ